MNAGEDIPGSQAGPPESDSALTRKRTRPPAPPGHQRMRELLAERARLLQPGPDFYDQILARTSGREPMTGPVMAPTFAAERAAPAIPTPPTSAPVQVPDAKAAPAAKADKADKPDKGKKPGRTGAITSDLGRPDQARRADPSPQEPDTAERARRTAAEKAAMQAEQAAAHEAELARMTAAEAMAKQRSSTPPGAADAPERTEIDSVPGRDGNRDASGEVMAAGRIIGGYRIEHPLGRGGMGEVYRATQLSVGRPVALKVLGRRLARNPDFRERFLREARAAGRLHHHNLIAVHDVGEAGGLMFFSMELVEGRTLKSLRADGPMTADLILSIIRQVLMALDYAHARGVVHRDIKPDNIMVTHATGQAVVKVADLGLSRIDGDHAGADDSDLGAVTEHGAVMGTPHYMAPEQGRDAHSADLRADLWSVGATWYFLHYGRPPFTGGNAMDVMLKASTDDLQFPQPAPSPAACAVIGRLMAKDPAQRPASAAAVLAMIDGMDTAPLRRKRVAKAKRGAWQIAGVAAALLLGVVLVSWAVRRYSHAVWWQGERDRIESLANDGHYGEAMAILHDDREQMSGSEAAAADAYAQDLESRWEQYAKDQADPMFARFDRDLAEHQYKEAQATLRQIPESLLCPPVKAEVERRGDALEQTLMDAADQPATGPSAANPEQRYQMATDDVRRQEMAIAAERFWRGFACTPAGTPAVDDGIATFQAVGRGQCDLRATGPLTQMRTRAFALRLKPGGSWNAEERWELDLGGAKIAVTSAGISLEEAGKPARLLQAIPARGDAVIRLRRNGSVWMAKVDAPKAKADKPEASATRPEAASPRSDDWLTLAGGEVLEVAWSLSDGNSLSVGFAGRTR